MQPNSLQNRCCCQTMPPCAPLRIKRLVILLLRGGTLAKNYTPTIPQVYPLFPLGTPFHQRWCPFSWGTLPTFGYFTACSEGQIDVPFDRSPIPKQPFAYTQTTDRLYSNSNAFQNEGQGWGTAGVGFDKHCPLITI